MQTELHTHGLDGETPVACDDCDWSGVAKQVQPIESLAERIFPGEIVPVGECPECGCLAHLQKKQPKAIYSVTAWWPTQRGCHRDIEADTPEQALKRAEEMFESGEWDLGYNEEFDDSDGPTNFETQADGKLHTALSDQERLNEMAPKLLALLKMFLEPTVPAIEETMREAARDAIARAEGSEEVAAPKWLEALENIMWMAEAFNEDLFSGIDDGTYTEGNPEENLKHIVEARAALVMLRGKG